MLVSIIFLLLSLVLLNTAPSEYSLTFCVTCLVLFAMVCLAFYRQRKKGEGLVTFNTFFLISFFLVSYAYPVFIHPSDFAEFFDMKHLITASNICVCTALCTVAICSYYFGYNLSMQTKRNNYQKPLDHNSFESIHNRNGFWYTISTIGVFMILYLFFTTNQEVNIEVSYAPFLFILFLICTIIALVTRTLCLPIKNRNWKNFLEANHKVIYVSLVVMLIYIIIGDRLLIVELGLILIGVYSLFYKKIRVLYLVAFLAVGGVLMTLLMYTRGGAGSLRTGGIDGFITESNVVMSENEAGGVWGFTSDLSGRFQELSYGYEMTKHRGHIMPNKIFATLVSPIPFLPNVVSNLVVGVPTSQTSAGYFIGLDSNTHAGSHCVIDIYMPWGVSGILFFFSLLGFVVAYFDRNKYNNIYGSVGYIVLLYQSVFIARGTIFDIYRTLVWAMLILYLYNHSRSKKQLKVIHG